MVVDDRGQIECYIVFCHAHLSWNLDNLDLDIDLDQSLRERIDLDETRVNGANKATEFGDQADVSLRNRLVGIWANHAARDGSKETNAGTERIDCVVISIA